MFIYLFLFFLLYLIGRYIFFSVKEGLEDNQNIAGKVNDLLGKQEDEGDDEDDEDDVYKDPSMTTVFAQLPILQAQSLAQEEQIERLNEELMELTGK